MANFTGDVYVWVKERWRVDVDGDDLTAALKNVKRQQLNDVLDTEVISVSRVANIDLEKTEI